MSKLIYFRNRHDADHIMAAMAEIAASLPQYAGCELSRPDDPQPRFGVRCR